MGRIFYQVAHPLHWLTYGQNATALAAVAAVLGLIGLFFYTKYTRRMMEMQESALRAAITPVLVLQGNLTFEPTSLDYPPQPALAQFGIEPPKIIEYRAVLKIRNIGAGAALFLRTWHQAISNKFVDNPLMILNRTTGSKDGVTTLTELMQGESATVIFEGVKPVDLQRRWIFVMETIDQTNEKHQLKVVRTPVGDDQAETAVTMVHGERRKKGWVARNLRHGS
jgi:hypothetical protein